MEKGWLSHKYAHSDAQKWVYEFRVNHTRATNALLDICGKSVGNLINLASCSQIGWNMYKICSKQIESFQKDNLLYYFSVDNDKRRELLINTIQALRQNLSDWLETYGDMYNSEAEYLTKWFLHVLK